MFKCRSASNAHLRLYFQGEITNRVNLLDLLMSRATESRRKANGWSLPLSTSTKDGNWLFQRKASAIGRLDLLLSIVNRSV